MRIAPSQQVGFCIGFMIFEAIALLLSGRLITPKEQFRISRWVRSHAAGLVCGTVPGTVICVPLRAACSIYSKIITPVTIRHTTPPVERLCVQN
jgi:hypothetical protein